jgi:hypothetical protein
LEIVLVPKESHAILVKEIATEILTASLVLNVVKETILKTFRDLPVSKNSKARREAKMVQTNTAMVTTAITLTITKRQLNATVIGLTPPQFK